jgi:hypothetical protein
MGIKSIDQFYIWPSFCFNCFVDCGSNTYNYIDIAGFSSYIVPTYYGKLIFIIASFL